MLTSATLEASIQTSAPRLEPRAASVELQSEFQRMARLISPKDRSTQDDLVQEMTLAALECGKPNTRSYYLQLGVSRALNYLRWWTRPMRRPRSLTATQETPEVSAAVKRLEQSLALG